MGVGEGREKRKRGWVWPGVLGCPACLAVGASAAMGRVSCLPWIGHWKSPRWGQGWGWGQAGPAQQLAKGHHSAPVSEDRALGL